MRISKSTIASESAAMIAISRRLSEDVNRLRFGAPVTHVYNPLDYAWAPHEQYLTRYAAGKGRVLLVGMNPGPFGMAQTGVPFGDVAMVRDFLGIQASVTKPRLEHPKRPVVGFACTRGEVSGGRLWGFAEQRFQTAAGFFSKFFVANYCPLVFMEASSRNRTPDKLSPSERAALYEICDRALREVAIVLAPRFVVGVGAFAETRAKAALAGLPIEVGCILHPSPANPRANSGWAEIVTEQLHAYGIEV